MGARNEVFERYKFEYAHGTKTQKSAILDKVCERYLFLKTTILSSINQLTEEICQRKDIVCYPDKKFQLVPFSYENSYGLVALIAMLAIAQ